jgi:hypothetical protein
MFARIDRATSAPQAQASVKPVDGYFEPVLSFEAYKTKQTSWDLRNVVTVIVDLIRNRPLRNGVSTAANTSSEKFYQVVEASLIVPLYDSKGNLLDTYYTCPQKFGWESYREFDALSFYRSQSTDAPTFKPLADMIVSDLVYAMSGTARRCG